MFVHRLKKAGEFWIEDQAPQMGAALAYYMLFSLAPLLIIALAIASQAYDETTARGEVIQRTRDFMGDESAGVVQTMLENFRRLPTGIGPAIVGVVSLIFGALSVFTQLRASLNRIWRVEAPLTQGIFLGTLKNYLLAFLMVQVVSAFVLILLTVSTLLVTVQVWFNEYLPGQGWVWSISDFLVSAFLLTLLFAFTFRFMSDGKVRYRHVWEGAFVGALLFCVGKLLLGWYFTYSQLGSAYGAAGSLVVFLAWMYYSAQIFFFGAEMVRVKLELHKA